MTRLTGTSILKPDMVTVKLPQSCFGRTVVQLKMFNVERQGWGIVSEVRPAAKLSRGVSARPWRDIFRSEVCIDYLAQDIAENYSDQSV
jgi:hypothetical protein